ncbi:MAG: VOC family protein [Gammaproteobacteria bacterium]|nr:VOC family protein [Gammaproteobacteria bacterium]
MPRIAIAVRDFDKIITTFRDQFGMPVIDISDTSVESLGAKLAMCVPEGGSNIEIMCPEVADAPLCQSLQRFLDRRGEGLFALMLEAPAPDDEAQVLLERGLNVLPLMAGAGGRDIHPKSTHGVLIRVYPDSSFQGQKEPTDESLSLSGITRVMIAVRDIDQAVAVYGTKLGMPTDPIIANEERGVRSAICHPPTGGMIELVCVENKNQPQAKSIEAFLQSRGEGMFALVLETQNLSKTAEVLSHRGLNLETVTDDAIEIAQADTYGAQIRIESK